MLFSESNFPLIMGILNITPDSFYSKSCIDYDNLNNDKFKYADIVDIGCESSRPGSSPISNKKEFSRLLKFINYNQLSNQYLSIDTYKPEIARYALENGFFMINDIQSGGRDYLMMDLAVEFDCPIIFMHMKGEPNSMQKKPFYEDVIGDIMSFFENKLKIAAGIGIKSENIILDPGIGFGKRIQDNYNIIRNLNKIKQFNHRILVGLSRKSFLSVNSDGPESRLTSTIAATVLAIQNGVDILRVHDVEDTYKLIKTMNQFNDGNLHREVNEV